MFTPSAGARGEADRVDAGVSNCLSKVGGVTCGPFGVGVDIEYLTVVAPVVGGVVFDVTVPFWGLVSVVTSRSSLEFVSLFSYVTVRWPLRVRSFFLPIDIFISLFGVGSVGGRVTMLINIFLLVDIINVLAIIGVLL